MTRILVRLPNWVGDAAMSLPALAAIRRHWPSARLDLVAHPRVAGLVSGMPDLGACLTIPARGGTGWREVVGRLRAERYDLGFLLTPSFSSAFLFSLGGIRERVGRRGQGRDWLLTMPLPPGDRLRSQVSQYVDIVRSQGYSGDDPPLALSVSASARQAALAWLKERQLVPGQFLAMAPGATYGPAKLWPAAQFAIVARALHQRRGWPTVLVGAPTERGILDDVASGLTGLVHLFDRPELADVVALLSMSGALLANDTGALHLGRAAGARVVGLFASTSPEWTGPSASEGEAIAAPVACRPCFRRRCPLTVGRYACLSAIEPGDVVTALERQADRPAIRTAVTS